MRGSNYLVGHICHSFVSQATSAPLLFDTHSAGFRKKSDEPANRAFFEWMMSASPVRNFILNDDIETLLEGGAIIDCQKAGPAVVLWICKAFRVATEDMWRIPLWHQLVQAGVHPLLAHCVSHCVTPRMVEQYAQTHCSIYHPPKTEAHVKHLLTVDHLPDSKEGLKTARFEEFETCDVFCHSVERGRYAGWSPNILPIAKEVGTVRVPDGWGGFIEKRVGEDVKTLAEALIKLQQECK